MINTDKHGNKLVTGKMQRLVSNDKIGVIALIDGTDRTATWTIHDVEEFATEELAMDRIEEKKCELLDSIKQVSR